MAAAYQKKYNRPAADKAWMAGWHEEPAQLHRDGEIDRARRNRSGTRGMEVSSRRHGHRLSRLRPSDDGPPACGGIHPKITDKWDYFDIKAELPKTPDDVAKAFGTKADSVCKMDTL